MYIVHVHMETKLDTQLCFKQVAVCFGEVVERKDTVLARGGHTAAASHTSNLRCLQYGKHSKLQG